MTDPGSPAPADDSADTLAERLVGRSLTAAAYTVTTERVAEFAAATGATYAGGAAPTTFPIVPALATVKALLDDPAVGVRIEHVVHGEQRFDYARPVLPGDVLTTTATVRSVRSIGGADVITASSDLVDGDGARVVTAHTVLVHRAPEEPGA